jgi:hypothetical protein
MPGKPHARPQSPSFGSDERSSLRIAAALDWIPIAFTVAPASV